MGQVIDRIETSRKAEGKGTDERVKEILDEVKTIRLDEAPVKRSTYLSIMRLPRTLKGILLANAFGARTKVRPLSICKVLAILG